MATPLPKTSRLDIVDALRGFALFSIVILHNIEQFNILHTPEWQPAFMQQIDNAVLWTALFLFGGKAYAIFSLLFGFSFYIQIKNQAERGVDFRWRFIWRLVLLFGFGLFHSLFYPGDILVLYAVVGLTLIPVSRFSNRALLITAIIMLLQPLEWARIIYATIDPDFVVKNGGYMPYYAPVKQAITEGTLAQTFYTNMHDGLLYSNIWAAENGRLFQTSALFMFGMLLGRCNLFVKSESATRFWLKVLLVASVAFVPLYAIRLTLTTFMEEGTIRVSSQVLAISFSNFTFTAILVSAFILLWHKGKYIFGFQNKFIPYGRMSLTNYITQSIIGTFIYFGWGLGMYQYFGATTCLLTGVIIFVAQQQFSLWWLQRHKQGPFEYIWKQGTWLLSNKKPHYK